MTEVTKPAAAKRRTTVSAKSKAATAPAVDAVSDKAASDKAAPDAADRSRAAHAAAGQTLHHLSEMRHNQEEIHRIFETGEYPYHQKIKRAVYERQKASLQAELLKAQRWIQDTDQKVVILFEGRDAAGKGGTIKRFMEDRKSTRLNSSHITISYAVFCLKKKKKRTKKVARKKS